MDISKVILEVVMTASVVFAGQGNADAAEVLTVGGYQVQLAGSDEFTGAAGTAPNPTIWGYDTGGGGWGNNELQTYTSSTNNAALDGQGHLAITVRKSGNSYTSARLVTRDKFTFTNGYIEASIKVPAGQGFLPAFWLLGTNIPTAGWPSCGEIDIMETVNDATKLYGTVHGPTVPATPNGYSYQVTAGNGVPLSNAYHRYGLLRKPGIMGLVYDGNVIGTIAKSQLPYNQQWVFDAPMYALLNVAVGGNWPGSPNATTRFPSQMLVDYVRYYQ